jgi:hypothetical protein
VCEREREREREHGRIKWAEKTPTYSTWIEKIPSPAGLSLFWVNEILELCGFKVSSNSEHLCLYE